MTLNCEVHMILDTIYTMTQYEAEGIKARCNQHGVSVIPPDTRPINTTKELEKAVVGLIH